jgi:hexosaminidase
MRYIRLIQILFLITATVSCSGQLKDSSKQNYISPNVDVIPIPNEVIKSSGFFEIDKKTALVYDESLNNSAQFFSKFINQGLGYNLAEDTGNNTSELFKPTKSVEFSVNDSITSDEGYRIAITKNKLLVEASTDKGAFFAVQTLRQLLPASFENSSYNSDKVKLDLLRINDSPEYSYRGFMLDVARHFYSVEDVKRLVDLLAIYKINSLHLHLTDDQGWRIEIKSWPNLTAIGSKISVNNERGGFYTQEDYLEIQEYALKHHIVIIPEIDMPGHTNSALSTYAELNCDNKATEPYIGTEVGLSSLCVNKDITYKFIDDVIGEIADLTKGEYIHIGGDESLSTEKSDYLYFIERAINIVKSYDKKVIGWDEIVHSDIDSSTVIEFWSKTKNAKLGVKKGAKVIMSPAEKIYFDIKYNDSTKLGLKWAGLNPVDDSYDWVVEDYIKRVDKEDILGIEASLWAETIITREDMEYMLFPRLPGAAELGWSKSKNRNWNEYKLRLAKQKERFEALKINYYKSPLVQWEE